MPDKKLTDNEIIKALECLAYYKECAESGDCPYYMDNGNMCDNIQLAKDILDLINRKDAKIAELTEENNRLQADKKSLEARNVILKGMVDYQKAENENLKDILYDAEGVNLVNYWHQQCEIANNGCRIFAEENKNLKAEIERLKKLNSKLEADVYRKGLL